MHNFCNNFITAGRTRNYTIYYALLWSFTVALKSVKWFYLYKFYMCGDFKIKHIYDNEYVIQYYDNSFRS